MRKKKIVILSAAFGEGHNAAARGLRDGLLQFAQAANGEVGEVEVKVIDIFEIYGAAYKMARKAYLSMISQTPRIWEKIYQMIDANERQPPKIAMMQIKSKLAKTLAAEQPDIVVSTYPAYSFLVNALFSRGKRRPFPLVTIITDSITINSIWYHSPSDWYLVPNEASASAIPTEIPRAQIRVTGFPVNPIFANREADNRAQTVAQSPSVLYIINRQHGNPIRLIRELLAEQNIRLTVAVGHHKILKKKVGKILAGFEERAEVFGWSDRLPELMRSHHLLISKAGGATVQESIAAHTPMIVNQFVPGQETGNVRLLLEHGCGTLRDTPELVISEIKGAFANGGKVWKQWHENLQTISRPRASLEIAEWLLSL